MIAPEITIPRSAAVKSPELIEETGTEEAIDLPWQVVVHNDPVNLMTYVTMVFQKVFGYPREKAERHMLEVHQQGPLDFVERYARTRGILRPAAAWISAARHDRARHLIWNSAASGDLLEISELDPFLAELLRQIPGEHESDGTTAAEQRLFSAPAPA